MIIVQVDLEGLQSNLAGGTYFNRRCLRLANRAEALSCQRFGD